MQSSQRKRHIAIVALSLLWAAGCIPSHPVKPLPAFVDLAIKPGDRVEVTTYAHDVFEFEVAEVSGEALVSKKGRSFPLADIIGLKKISWEKPPSPCGGEKELGCSVPLLVSLISEEHDHYRKSFYTACEQHDYCYRHGEQTYGYDRNYCDSEFLTNMRAICPPEQRTVFGFLKDLASDDVDSRTVCLQVANDFHLAARNYGEKHFQSSNSTYCEYNGPR